MNQLKHIFILFTILALTNSISCFNIFSFFSSLFEPPTTYKLTYFNIRGRAEFLRYMMAYAKQPYDDARVEQADWPKLKPTTPFGQIPTLEIRQGNSVNTIAQSSAIGKYLANKFCIAGKNDIDIAYVDMYTSQLLDLFDQIGKYQFETNATAREQLFNQTWSTNMPIFENKLAQTNTGYLVGNALTWADLYLSSILDNLGDRYNQVLASFSKIKALDQKVKSVPQVADWLKKRPVSPI
jgi:glutathione S-transferase